MHKREIPAIITTQSNTRENQMLVTATTPTPRIYKSSQRVDAERRRGAP